MKKLLKSKGLKYTKQREMLLNTINDLKDEATSINIVKYSNHIDKSTIYRTLDMFVEKDILTKIINYNNETYYMIKEEHGHYFTCIRCHKKEKLSDCPLDSIEKKLEKKNGYKVLNHTIEINGICCDCNAKEL